MSEGGCLPCRPAAEIKGSSDEMEKSHDVEDEEGVPLVPKEKEKHEQSAQQLAEEMMMEKNLGDELLRAHMWSGACYSCRMRVGCERKLAF